MNFITITRTNHNGDLKETLLNADYIVSVKERTLPNVNLYNEEGELVKTETPTEKVYKVIMKGGEWYNISESEYTNLVKALTK